MLLKPKMCLFKGQYCCHCLNESPSTFVHMDCVWQFNFPIGDRLVILEESCLVKVMWFGQKKKIYGGRMGVYDRGGVYSAKRSNVFKGPAGPAVRSLHTFYWKFELFLVMARETRNLAKISFFVSFTMMRTSPRVKNSRI